MATSNDTPLSPSVLWPSKVVVSSCGPAKDGFGKPSYGRRYLLLIQNLAHSFQPCAKRLVFGTLLAICFGPALPVRGDELPVQRAVHANRNLYTRSYRQNGRVSTPIINDDRIAKAQSEELPGGRTDTSAFDDPFEVQGDLLRPTLDQSMDDWFGDDDRFDGKFENENAGWVPCRMWARAENLLWMVEGFFVPPLLTTSPTGTNRTSAGRLDQATTTILFGNEDLVDTVRPGGRIRLGYWLDDCQLRGIEASYLSLAGRRGTFGASSQGDPILARPFFNVEPGFEGQDAELVAFPALLQGEINIDAKSTFEAGEVLYRRVMCRQCDYQINFLVGWRFNRLNDHLTIRDSKIAIGAGGAFAIGTTLDEMDHFATRNVFHGVEVGVVTEKVYCDWSFELSTKLAFGNTRSRYLLDGSTTVSVPVPGAAPAVAVTPVGLLAQGTNIGAYTDDAFTLIPEVSVLAGYQVARNCRVTLGYTFMVWSHVARPGDSIDGRLNLSQLDPGGLVGPAQPAFALTTSSVWAQGLNLGLDVKF